MSIIQQSRYGWKGYRYGRRKRSSIPEALFTLDIEGELTRPTPKEIISQTD